MVAGGGCELLFRIFQRNTKVGELLVIELCVRQKSAFSNHDKYQISSGYYPMSNIIQSIGLISAGNGIGLTATNGGDSQNPILVVKSLIAGAGIMINVNDSLVDLTISATGLPPLTSLITASAHWAGTAVNPNVLPIFIAAYPLVVTAIFARVEQISTTPATLTLVKAVNGVAVTSGLALAAAFDVTSPAHLYHRLVLTADITVLTLAPGDCIGMTTTGTWTNAYGGLTIHLAPSYP
jgi:hypothetical protein